MNLPKMKELQMILYSTPDADVTVSAIIENDTLWLNQNSMAELFDTSKQSISYHLSNIFSEHELDKDSVVKEFLTTATDVLGFFIFEHTDTSDKRKKSRTHPL